MSKKSKGSIMKRNLFYIYGIIGYLFTLGVFFYLICFLSNTIVPKTIDSGNPDSIFFSLTINILLIALFGLQHSIMARSGFKKWWTKFIPEPIERSTFVFSANVILILIITLWQPMPEKLWYVTSQPVNMILWILNGIGWIFLFISTRLINEKHLFGIQQVKDYKKGKELSDPGFQTPAFYKFTRHPMMLGFLIAFWVTPEMSTGHLIFSSATTLYILIGVFGLVIVFFIIRKIKAYKS
jgi:protein-S-isoprenylcysteine O-methyltransferase Ste14